MRFSTVVTPQLPSSALSPQTAGPAESPHLRDTERGRPQPSPRPAGAARDAAAASGAPRSVPDARAPRGQPRGKAPGTAAFPGPAPR